MRSVLIDMLRFMASTTTIEDSHDRPEPGARLQLARVRLQSTASANAVTFGAESDLARHSTHAACTRSRAMLLASPVATGRPGGVRGDYTLYRRECLWSARGIKGETHAPYCDRTSWAHATIEKENESHPAEEGQTKGQGRQTRPQAARA